MLKVLISILVSAILPCPWYWIDTQIYSITQRYQSPDISTIPTSYDYTMAKKAKTERLQKNHTASAQ